LPFFCPKSNLFGVNLFAQNGLLKPASTLFNLIRENITTYICPTFDVAQMLEEDAQNEGYSRELPVGKYFKTSI